MALFVGGVLLIIFVANEYKGKFCGSMLKSRGATPIFQNGDAMQMFKAQNSGTIFFLAGRMMYIGYFFVAMTEKLATERETAEESESNKEGKLKSLFVRDYNAQFYLLASHAGLVENVYIRLSMLHK